MYRQQSLITLDQFYEWKPLSKLEALLSFIDYTLLDEYFKPDSHRRGPKGYSKKQLFNTLIFMQIEQFSDIKSLVTRLKSDPVLRRSLGYDYFENTPSEATLNRFIKTLAESDILEKIRVFRIGVESWIPTTTSSNGLDGKCMHWLILTVVFQSPISSHL